MRRAAAALGLFALVIAAPLSAQRAGGRGAQAPRSPAIPPAEARALAIRAELAEVLLQSQRYAEAAREYRRLVEADSASIRYRMGLAQALAWGERYREAERELRILAVARPGDAAVDTLIRTVRGSLRPGSREATEWVRERPTYAPYRHSLASALAREGHLDAALAQIDTVLLWARSPSAMLERARINIARRDLDAAVTDLSASIASGPTADAYLALGDIHRWRGDFAGARTFYAQAGLLAPSSRDVTARFAQLARDERPAMVLGTPVDVQSGWRANAAHTSDNVGTEYSTISTHRGFSAPFGLLGSTGVEIRHLRERLPLDEPRTTGYAADLALARGASRGAFHGEVRALGGIVHHPGAGSRPFGAIGLTGQYFAWTAAMEMSGGPAYQSLLTTAFLDGANEDQPWLVEQTFTTALAGPIAQADAGMTVRQSEFNDGNRRVAVQGYARYPLARRVVAVYSGSVIAFARRSPHYWDPSSHVANALGIQLAERRPRGLSWSATVLPGVAFAEDTPYLRAPLAELDDTRLRPQIAATGELVYRAARWEASAVYGWGRLAGYQRSDARIGLRFVP